MNNNKGPAIIVTSRAPIDGRCKTRLSSMLSQQQRQDLQTAMILDEMHSFRKTGLPILLFITPSNAEQEMRKLGITSCMFFPQTGTDLGEMMKNAFSKAFSLGYSPCVLIGTDIPEYDDLAINEAFTMLGTHDIVITPTLDGGYCLIGMNEMQEAAFQKIEYGTSSVLEKTIETIKKTGKSIALTQAQRDIDTPEDLIRFAAKGFQPRCPRSSKLAMDFRLESISIIIPAYNEEAALPSLLAQLDSIRNDCEIIFVDGGSSDQTAHMIKEAGYPCHQEKGRGRQLNEGARHAHGDILFFLHCDSIIPHDALSQIREILDRNDAGFFGIKFDTHEWVMKVCGRQSNRRAKYRQIPFGDQGIFLRSNIFWKVGGFPEIPLMEDYEFSLRLRKRKIRFGQTRDPIITSARRYGKGFFHQLKVMYQMHELRYLYRHGHTPEKLKKRYEKI